MANKETKLRIVIEAQNKVNAAFNELKSNLDGIKTQHEGLASAMTAVGVAGTAMFAGLAAATMGFIKAGANFEQTQIAFETMIGSGERANKLLDDLAKLASKTPFQLPQLEEASKRLLAYGIAVDDIIPTLTMLGDISAGVGMDKLPQLILAFGQVSAATKLTGMELRQFSESGVPLLGALVDQFNKTGVATKVVTNAAGMTTKQIDKLGKTNEAVKDKIYALNIQLEKQNNRMKEMQKNDKDSGASYKNLKIDISETKSKLAEYNEQLGTNNQTLGLAATKITKMGEAAKVTAADVQEMISNGEVSFEQVKMALEGMTKEGGRFHEMMARQATTLGGLWSNLVDQISLTSRAIGNELVPMLKPLVVGMIEVMTVLQGWIKEHPKLAVAILGVSLAVTGLMALLLPLLAVLPMIAAGWTLVAGVMTGAFAAAAIATGGLLVIIAAEIIWIIKMLYDLRNDWDLVWLGIKLTVADVVNSVVSMVEAMINKIIEGINLVIESVNSLLSRMSKLPMIGKQFKKMQIETLQAVTLQGIDTDAMVRDTFAKREAKSVSVVVTGNTLLDKDAAVLIGDQIMSQLKLSNNI